MNYSLYDFSKKTNASNYIEVDGNDKGCTLDDKYPKVLYFTASWCGPCKRIYPLFKSLVDTNKSITFYKIDINKNEELAAAYKIETVPTFHFYPSRNRRAVFTGADEDKLRSYIKNIDTVETYQYQYGK